MGLEDGSGITALSLHVSRLKSLDTVKNDHEIALHLVARLTDQDGLVQHIRRAGIVHDRGRLGDLSERRRVVPFRKHRLVTSDSGGPELLSPPCGHVVGIAGCIQAVGQGRQVCRVTRIAVWGCRPRAMRMPMGVIRRGTCERCAGNDAATRESAHRIIPAKPVARELVRLEVCCSRVMHEEREDSDL